MSQYKTMQRLAPSGREAIADHIRMDIMSGALRFGQRLSEATYAERFGVSRTPVRDAILGLVSLGLIVVRPRSGTFVVSFTRASLKDLFEVRQTLEVSGVRLATATQRRALVARIEAMAGDLNRDVETAEDFDQFSLSDTEFHTLLVEAADNTLLSQIYRPIAASAQAARSRLDKSSSVSDTANAHHFAILEALRTDDIDRFEAVLKEHLAWVLGILMQVDELFVDA